MATPVKNYTDPTYLCKRPPVMAEVNLGSLLLNTVLPAASGVTAPRMPAPVAPIPNTDPLNGPKLMRVPVVPVLRVPEPPFGRQIIVTFPAIYKERNTKLILLGQVYPPPAHPVFG